MPTRRSCLDFFFLSLPPPPLSLLLLYLSAFPPLFLPIALFFFLSRVLADIKEASSVSLLHKISSMLPCLEAPLLERHGQQVKKRERSSFFFLDRPKTTTKQSPASSSSGAPFSLFACLDREKQARDKAMFFQKTRPAASDATLFAGKRTKKETRAHA